MKGSASQPHHKSRRDTGKRSAQAGGLPTAAGVRDRSRMAATCRGAGRSPQSPTAVRRDAIIHLKRIGHEKLLTSELFKERVMRSGNLLHRKPHHQISGSHLENSF